jgi:hypothetical protein
VDVLYLTGQKNQFFLEKVVKIDVVFRPSKGQAGSKQTKTVTVSANTSPENTILKITAFVNKTAE